MPGCLSLIAGVATVFVLLNLLSRVFAQPPLRLRASAKGRLIGISISVVVCVALGCAVRLRCAVKPVVGLMQAVPWLGMGRRCLRRRSVRATTPEMNRRQCL
jgi:hypothetical protein